MVALRPVLPVQNSPAGVTIAIPNWNHELLLPRSVGSAIAAVDVLARMGVHGEVMVFDDHSRDGSLVLLRQLEALYHGKGLRLIALARNNGLPGVRNLALSLSSYRYIVFMDADNELVPENLGIFYRAIVETGAAAVYGNLLVVTTGEVEKLMSSESFQGRMFRENYVDAFAFVDKVQLADAGGYLTSGQVSGREDWEMYLHLAAEGRVVALVPAVFGKYYDLPISMIKAESNSHAAQQTYVRRVFDQLGVRDRLPLRSRHVRYHPDIGYL